MYLIEIFWGSDETQFKKFIDNNLSHSNPIIHSVGRNYGHYLVIGGKIGDDLIIIDSGAIEFKLWSKRFRAKPVNRMKWNDYLEKTYAYCCECDEQGEELGEIWCTQCDGYGITNDKACLSCRGTGYFICDECKGVGAEYYAIAIKPKAGIHNHPSSIVHKLGKVYNKLKNDKDLRSFWGYYLEGLTGIVSKYESDTKNSIKLSTTINNNMDLLIKSILSSFDDIPKNDIRYELNNLILIADMYDMKIPKSKINEALILFTCVLLKSLLYE